MDYLRTFAEEYGLREIVESLADQPSVQGAILRLDELWLTAWRLQEVGLLDEWERWLWRYRHWDDLWVSEFASESFASSSMSGMPWIPRGRPDLQWRPPQWDDFSRMKGRKEEIPPVHLVVCLRPPAKGENVVIPDLPRRRLSVSFEVRPIARLATGQRAQVRPVVGGISVGAGKKIFGTLGGVAEDQAGERYGMTCAHVFPSTTSVEQPALYDDTSATSIGVSISSIPLQPCPGNGPCNPYSNSPHIAAIDTSLVEFEDGILSDLEILSIGRLSGVVAKNSMTTGQEVTFEGRSSGQRIAEVGGLCVFYRLQINAQAYCFRDLFEIRWRSFFRSVFGPIVRAGDSGAWVVAETDQGPAWCGQVIGEDRHVGYAAFSENIVSAWSAIGKDLIVA